MRKCVNCNIELKNKNKFCSHSCSAIFNNKKRIKIVRKCIFCESILNTNRNYCNYNCEKSDIIEKWKSGKISGTISRQRLKDPIRKYILDKAGNKCSKCGWCEINPKTGNTPIEIDHIDGDVDNNKEENLRVLCPNCHSLTPTYKALNIGKGRKNRYAPVSVSASTT